MIGARAIGLMLQEAFQVMLAPRIAADSPGGHCGRDQHDEPRGPHQTSTPAGGESRSPRATPVAPREQDAFVTPSKIGLMIDTGAGPTRRGVIGSASSKQWSDKDDDGDGDIDPTGTIDDLILAEDSSLVQLLLTVRQW